MRLMVLAATAAVLVSGGTALADTAAGSGGDTVVQLRGPTPDEIYKAFPAKARYERMGGTAAMQCRIDAKGLLQECAVVSETPQGWGFGDATLRLARRFQISPTTRNGGSVAGMVLTVPITFRTENFRTER